MSEVLFGGRGSASVMNFLNDLKFAVRSLVRTKGLTITVVLTLALGIGASTAIFSVVNAVLLRPFGYAEPKRLIEIHGLDKDGKETGVSVRDFEAFQERAHSFQRMGMSRLQTFTLSGLRQPENVYGELVSRECLATLGANPLMGRTFLTGDFQSGAPQVAILSHKLWQTSFEADPHIIGRRILMNGEEYTVIGVMAPDFH